VRADLVAVEDLDRHDSLEPGSDRFGQRTLAGPRQSGEPEDEAPATPRKRKGRRRGDRRALAASVVRAQDLGDFRTRELARQVSTRSQDLAHLAAGQLEAILLPVWAGPCRRQGAAHRAIERRIEPQRFHAELADIESIEDPLRFERIVNLPTPAWSRPTIRWLIP